MSGQGMKKHHPDPVFVLRTGSDSITSVSFATYGSNKQLVLLSGNQNGSILIWDLKTRRVIKQFQASEKSSILYASIIDLADEQCLISHDRAGLVKLYAVPSEGNFVLRKSWKVFEFGFCPIQTAEYNGDVWFGYPSGADSQVSVTQLNSSTISVVHQLNPVDKLGMVMLFRMFTKDTNFVMISGYESGSIMIWNIKHEVAIDAKTLYENPVMCLDVHSETMKVVVGSSDDIINMVSISKVRVVGKEAAFSTLSFITLETDLAQDRFSFNEHDDRRFGDSIMENSRMDLRFAAIKKHVSKSSGFSSTCIRRDGKVVCYGAWDGKLRVFSGKSLRPLAILKYHSEGVGVVGFSENNLLAGGCKDGKISLWDVYQNV